MADEKLQDESDAMEGDLHQLEEHIDDAKQQLEQRKRQDADPDRAETASTDGPETRDTDDDEPDARVDEEMANPT